MMLHVLRAVLVWLNLWCALPVWGCRYDIDTIDKRLLAERLEEAPLVFIGTVSHVSTDRTIEFQIEHLLHGEVEGQRFRIKSGQSSCDLRFAVGQRWIYGGTTLFHPSVLLADSGHIGSSLIRVDDSRLALPSEWQACDSDASCSMLPYGCTDTAVNKNYAATAKEKSGVSAVTQLLLNATFPFTRFNVCYANNASVDCGHCRWISEAAIPDYPLELDTQSLHRTSNLGLINHD